MQAPCRIADCPPLTQSPAFRRWFAASKVTNELGEPLLAFHGAAERFTAFRRTNLSWFTDSREDAADYNPRAMLHVYLSIQKPADLDEPDVARFLKRHKLPDSDDLWELTQVGAQVRQVLHGRGYDGLVVTRFDLNATHYAAFWPEQVKSATDNNGEFNPETPDLRR